MKSFVKNKKSLLSVLHARKIPAFAHLSDVCDFVTKRVMKLYKLREVEDINYGYCFIWSYLVDAMWKGDLKFVTNSNHVVLFDDKTEKYYDSEHPTGTKDVHIISGMDLETNVSVDRQVMTFYWAHVGFAKIEFSEIIQKVDPSDLVASKEYPYLDPFEADGIEPSDIIADVQALNRETVAT